MKKLLSFFILCLPGLCFISVSCKKPDKAIIPTLNPNPVVKLSFKANVSGGSFTFNQLCTNSMSQKYFVNTFLFYAGNPRLVKSDGTEVSLKDILLVNFDPNINTNDATHDPATVGTSFNLSVPAGTYTAFRFGIGVPKNLDGKNESGKVAADYPNSHPLGFYRGTYWDWLDLYRFLMIEGRVFGSDNVSYLSFQYHTGYDSLYTTVQFADNITLSNGNTHNINIDIDVNKIFEGIDMHGQTTTNMTAGDVAEGKLGMKIMQNLATAMTKE